MYDVDHLCGGVVSGVLHLQRGFIVYRQHVFVRFAAEHLDHGTDVVQLCWGDGYRNHSDLCGIVGTGDVILLVFIELWIRHYAQTILHLTDRRVFQRTEPLVADEEGTPLREHVDNLFLG